jgi:peroxiredoxin
MMNSLLGGIPTRTEQGKWTVVYFYTGQNVSGTGQKRELNSNVLYFSVVCEVNSAAMEEN